MKVGIVGGGAGGLMTALTLMNRCRDQGVEVTVYEKDPAAHTTLCGEGIRASTLTRFDDNAAFYSDPHVGEWFDGAAWHFPGGVTVNVDDACCTLERATWIPDMAEKFRERGGEYVTGKRIAQEDVDALAGEFDLVVGADGPGSQVAKSIGATHTTMLGIQYRVEREDFHTDRLEFYTDKRWTQEYAWIFPKGTIMNVGLLAESSQDWAKLDDFKAAMGVTGEVVKREAYPIGFHGHKVQEGNVVLVGDAGGLTNPVTKGGLAAIVFATEILAGCIRDGKLHEYGERIFQHPITSPRFREAVGIIRDWSNADFEKLARFAPPVMTVGGSHGVSARVRYAWPLAKTMAANPGKVKDLLVLADAMGLSRQYSW